MAAEAAVGMAAEASEGEGREAEPVAEPVEVEAVDYLSKVEVVVVALFQKK